VQKLKAPPTGGAFFVLEVWGFRRTFSANKTPMKSTILCCALFCLLGCQRSKPEYKKIAPEYSYCFGPEGYYPLLLADSGSPLKRWNVHSHVSHQVSRTSKFGSDGPEYDVINTSYSLYDTLAIDTTGIPILSTWNIYLRAESQHGQILRVDANHTYPLNKEMPGWNTIGRVYMYSDSLDMSTALIPYRTSSTSPKKALVFTNITDAFNNRLLSIDSLVLLEDFGLYKIKGYYINATTLRRQYFSIRP
jgi:hypothetical protein